MSRCLPARLSVLSEVSLPACLYVRHSDCLSRSGHHSESSQSMSEFAEGPRPQICRPYKANAQNTLATALLCRMMYAHEHASKKTVPGRKDPLDGRLAPHTTNGGTNYHKYQFEYYSYNSYNSYNYIDVVVQLSGLRKRCLLFPGVQAGW